MLKESAISSFFLSDKNVTGSTLTALCFNPESVDNHFSTSKPIVLLLLVCHCIRSASRYSVSRLPEHLWQLLMLQWCWSNARIRAFKVQWKFSMFNNSISFVSCFSLSHLNVSSTFVSIIDFALTLQRLMKQIYYST